MLNELKSLKKEFDLHSEKISAIKHQLDSMLLKLKQESSFSSEKKIDIDLERLFFIVQHRFFICKKDLLSKKRHRELADLRFILYRILRDEGYLLKSIANVFNRDHSTIMHGLRQFNNLENNLHFVGKYKTINNLFNN